MIEQLFELLPVVVQAKPKSNPCAAWSARPERLPRNPVRFRSAWEWQPIPKTAPTPRSCLAEADRRMYKSKRSRRKANLIPIDATAVPPTEITAAVS